MLQAQRIKWLASISVPQVVSLHVSLLASISVPLLLLAALHAVFVLQGIIYALQEDLLPNPYVLFGEIVAGVYLMVHMCSPCATFALLLSTLLLM